MRNFASQGDVVELTAPTGGVVTGQGYVFGSGTPKQFAVAVASVAQTLKFAAAVEGVVELVKDTAADFSEGDPVFWDDTAKSVRESASGRYQIGWATQSVGVGVLLCKVKLSGQPVSPVV